MPSLNSNNKQKNVDEFEQGQSILPPQQIVEL